jgi:DNA helicase-2/ATP-dependent DNA helicase PcrA
MKLKIVGPPGTGKTTKLMELLEYELEKNRTLPKRIAFLTFTRAAREVALNRTGKSDVEFPFLRTIHAICYRQLGMSQEQIVKPASLRSFGSFIGVKLNGNNIDPWIEDFERGFETPTRDDILLQINHYGRHRGILLKEALQGASSEIDYRYATWFTRAYRNWKTSEGMLDYTDMLTKYLDEGQPLDIDVIFVDEAQDLSLLQWEVVSKLGANAQRWYISGDDDQAIFHWAGADSSMFQDIKVDKTEILGQSYRVSKSIHAAAQRIATRIKTRIPKEYSPTEDDGIVGDCNYLKAEDFDEKSFVLFRNHYRASELVRQLRAENIPYIGPGSPLNSNDVRLALQTWWAIHKRDMVPSPAVKKMVRFCDKEFVKMNIKTILDKKPYVSLADVFDSPPNIRDWSRIMSKLPGKDIIDEYVLRAGFKKTAKPMVELLSIHQSKGREAHTVVLDTEISRNVYDSFLKSPDDEHRVWYVGATRAKHKLLFLQPDGMYSYRV